MIQPLNDRVLIRRIEDESPITLTDNPKGIKGVILAVGPGKWVPGEWWKVKKVLSAGDGKTQGNILAKVWEWFPGHRQPVEYKVGQSVLFNSKWNDFSHAEHGRPMPLGADSTLHLVQEADIFCIIPDLKVSASIREVPLSQNIEIKGPWSDPANG